MKNSFQHITKLYFLNFTPPKQQIIHTSYSSCTVVGTISNYSFLYLLFCLVQVCRTQFPRCCQTSSWAPPGSYSAAGSWLSGSFYCPLCCPTPQGTSSCSRSWQDRWSCCYKSAHWTAVLPLRQSPGQRKMEEIKSQSESSSHGTKSQVYAKGAHPLLLVNCHLAAFDFSSISAHMASNGDALQGLN